MVIERVIDAMFRCTPCPLPPRSAPAFICACARSQVLNLCRRRANQGLCLVSGRRRRLQPLGRRWPEPLLF